jgi:hypothetical protein
VLRETDPQPSLWEALLPEQVRRLPAELARIDAYLDDECFVAPWRALFDQRLGCPSVPVESLLRLLYLKPATSLATRACAGRWPTRSRGGGFAASAWIGRCRTRPRWSSWSAVPARTRSDSSTAPCSASCARTSCCGCASCGWIPRWWRPTSTIHRRRPAGEGRPQAGWAHPAGQGPWRGRPHQVPGPVAVGGAAAQADLPDPAAADRAGASGG